MFRTISALLIAAMTVPALAGEAGDLARQHLYSGALSEGLEVLEPFDRRYDQEGRFGIGLIKFVQAVEHFFQGLYRYGFAVPEAGPEGPLLIPVPRNPAPEPIDYAKVRGLLEVLVSDFDDAHGALMAAGALGEYVIPVDILKIRIDADGDGSGTERETVGSVLGAVLGTALPAAGEQHDQQGAVPELVVGFDRADAIWLAGYSQVVAAQADFLLAHDFHELVAVAFHRLFPRAGLPMQDHIVSNSSLILDPQSDNAIADLVAAIHTLNFPVVEPGRLKRVLARLEDITQLSRQNWQAIIEETDDDRELLPGPRQHALDGGTPITDEQVRAWFLTLDTVSQILRGDLLLPHWRFDKGFNLKTYLEHATRFDLVLLLTGFDALPFLDDGPIADATSFAAASQVFGDSLWGYAFWFN